MVSNISLEITALAFTLFVLYHFLMDKKVNDETNRVFTFFISLGIMDICFDIISTILLEEFPGRYITLTKLCLTALYLLQSLLPYAIIKYTQSLAGIRFIFKHVSSIIYLCVAIAMGIMILVNYFVGFFFYYDDAGVYHKGPLYMLMYAYAAGCFVVVGVTSIVHRQEMTTRELMSLWEYLLILVVCVLIQFVTGTLLTIGLGIGLGITMLYITINNPNSNVDTFTGVPDRFYFDKWTKERIARKSSINIIALELHKYKWINKVYGAPVADQLILKLVSEINECIGTGHLFRISLSRFILEVDTREEYNRLKKLLHYKFETPVLVNGEECTLPAIICCIPDAERFDSAATLLEYVEYMVSLVTEGDDTILLQDEVRMMEGFMKEKEIERFMEEAVDEDLFQVYYQPVCAADTGKVVSLEALSRLVHPSMGHISPEMFIGIAEKNGQIERIGELQLKRVCDFIKNNEHVMNVVKTVKFNLSPQELLKDIHSRKLIEIIKESGLKPEYFEFEITETVATEYSDVMRSAIKNFIEAGIGLCLDDFGSGYANLNTVLRLPFSTIKIDRSLLSGIVEDEAVAGFYEKIVNVLKGMGYTVIAEGVESEDEYRLLSQWHVDLIQGYYFSRPLEEAEVVGLVADSEI